MHLEAVFLSSNASTTHNFNSSNRRLGSDVTSLFLLFKSLYVNRPILLLKQLTAAFTRWILRFITVFPASAYV
jgi:hypothetical protein